MNNVLFRYASIIDYNLKLDIGAFRSGVDFYTQVYNSTFIQMYPNFAKLNFSRNQFTQNQLLSLLKKHYISP